MAGQGVDVIWVRLRSKTPPHEWLVHPDLRARMVADADERGTNLTDLAKQILCNHFGVPYEPNLRRSKATSERDEFHFGAPPGLIRALALAYPRQSTRMDGVRQILCQHYGLRMPPKVKRTRQRRPSAAAA